MQKKVVYRSEMARNAIESDFRTSKMAAEKKNLYRSEIARIAIESEFQKSKMADRSEMARNAIETRISNIQNGRRQPFCQKNPKNLKLRIDLKWPEVRSKVNFGHPKWPTSVIL